jgi:hypothetical protein
MEKYSFKSHVEMAKDAGEHLTVSTITSVAFKLFLLGHDVTKITTDLVDPLKEIIAGAREDMNSIPNCTLEHGVAWSRLVIMENILTMINKTLKEDKDGG